MISYTSHLVAKRLSLFGGPGVMLAMPRADSGLFLASLEALVEIGLMIVVHVLLGRAGTDKNVLCLLRFRALG